MDEIVCGIARNGTGQIGRERGKGRAERDELARVVTSVLM